VVPGRLLVAEHDRRVVGTVTFYEDAAAEGLGWPPGWAGLRALGVEPAARGLGAGRALMDACLDRAEAARAPVLCLHTAAFMTAAVAIYEAMGFRRAPAFDFDVPAGGGAPPVGILAYRLDLPRDPS
jgi:predicted N-acetyltransferase YhbS